MFFLIKYFQLLFYLVLNSIYYIGQKNILDLDLSTEAVISAYEIHSSTTDRKRCQFLIVKYENHDRARKALNHFHDAYLTQNNKEFSANAATQNPSIFKLEAGWLGYKLISKYIAIVFECPDPESAKQIIQKMNP